MRRFASVSAIFLALFIGACDTSLSKDQETIYVQSVPENRFNILYKALRTSIVEVYGREGYKGTGVIIGQSVVTAAHLVHGRPRARVIFFDQSEAEAFVLKRDKSADLARLKLTRVPSQAAEARIDISRLKVGESVITISHPIGMKYTLFVGFVSRSESKYPDLGLRVLVQSPGQPGMSGGGLFDLSGNLRGIGTEYHRHGSFTFYAPIHLICLKLFECKQEEQVQ